MSARARSAAAPTLVALGLVVLSLTQIAPALRDPVRWTPDGLFYQARVLQLRGADHDAAIREVFTGPISQRARTIDPEHVADPAWVAYNEQFYERRIGLPIAAAVLTPAAGDRALMDVTAAGYVAAVLAIFLILLMRFRLVVAGGVAALTALLPALVHHSSYPLTDSWGVTLEAIALAAAVLTLERGRRWLLLWAATILVLAFTRDSIWIPVLAGVWCAIRFRTRISLALAGSGIAAMLPAALLFRIPMRELIAFNVVGHDIATDTSWGFIARHYPGALENFLRSDAGFVFRGAWYTAAYLGVGIVSLFLLTWRSKAAWPVLLQGASVVALIYVLSIPAFSAFRIELIFVPMASFGLAYAAEWVAARLGVVRAVKPAPAPRQLAAVKRS
jgi:hypothetical protein